MGAVECRGAECEELALQQGPLTAADLAALCCGCKACCRVEVHNRGMDVLKCFVPGAHGVHASA